MSKFTNLKTFIKETTLYQQEVDVILAVIDQVLASFEQYPTKGTFILDGQEMGEDAKCIIRFNLEDGAYPLSGGLEDCTSDDIATMAINDVLSWPEVPAYGYKGEARFFGQLPSGIYKRGRQKVLVLNTTYGRFLMSFFANCQCGIDEHDDGSALLLALAVAFASIDQKDKILRQSVENITTSISCNEESATDMVLDLFAKCELPALIAWKDWCESANSSDELPLFFE